MEDMVTTSRKVSSQFWQGKRVFLTGHTGFKGSWLSLWLQRMGASVKGYALEPITSSNLFDEASVSDGMISEIGDIRNLNTLSKSITNFNPDILIHMAAQPLVRLSYIEPIATYETNVMGTLNVLEAARKCENIKAILAITTDKCYENDNRDFGYAENQPMGGYDPYSSSKGCCELLISSYRRSFFSSKDSPNLASARAGNVIGGGDWSLNRLVPDILKSFESNNPVVLRNPLAIRPWQHVLEPLFGYLILAEDLYKKGTEYSGAWNFGPNDEDCKSVEWILKKMITIWGEGASYEIDTNFNPHEANILKLDCSKAEIGLNWKPKWDLEKALELTIAWHKQWLSKGNMRNICMNEIDQYLNI
jgi:CDP-glucose 4,6-dehydratase